MMKTLLWALAALMVILTTGCDVLMKTAWASEPLIYVEVGDGYPAYIFPPSLAVDSSVEYLLDDDSISYWTPTEADVELAEQSFQVEIDRRLAETPSNEGSITAMEIVRDLIPDYYRHYVGFTQDDQQWIYGVYFCQDIPGWGVDVIPTILGGGTCLVEFTYELDSDTVSMLMVQGR